MFKDFISSSDTLILRGYLRLSSLALTFSPLLVIVAPISLTTTSWLTKGRPLQFILMWLNSRCSILFHLLVPGGRWQTVIHRPVSSTKDCSSYFQSRI